MGNRSTSSVFGSITRIFFSRTRGSLCLIRFFQRFEVSQSTKRFPVCKCAVEDFLSRFCCLIILCSVFILSIIFSFSPLVAPPLNHLLSYSGDQSHLTAAALYQIINFLFPLYPPSFDVVHQVAARFPPQNFISNELLLLLHLIISWAFR